MKPVSVAIVGADPRGLAILERLSALLGPTSLKIQIDVRVIDPGKPGQGIHRALNPITC